MKDGSRFNKGRAMDLIMSESCALSSDTKFVAVHLINRSRPDPARPGWSMAWPAAVTMARALSLAPRAVEQAISDLRRHGSTLPVRFEVERRYRPGSGGRDSNMYRCCIPAMAAGMTGTHTRNGCGNAPPTIPAENGGHTRRNGGGIPAAPAEESSKEPSQEPSKGETLVLTPPVKAKTKSRKASAHTLPADFIPDASVYETAKRLELSRERVDVELEKLRDWAASKDARYVDWQATLRNWLRKAKEFESNRNGRRNGAPLKQSANGRCWQPPPQGTPQ